MRFDLVHLVPALALEHPAPVIFKDIDRIGVLLPGNGLEGIDVLDMRGMDDRPADKAVGLVQDDLTEKAVYLMVDDGDALEQAVLDVVRRKALEHHALAGTEIFPYRPRYDVVVGASEDVHYVGQYLAHGHDVIYGVVHSAPDTEAGGEVRSAHPDLKYDVLVFVQDLLYAHQLARSRLAVSHLRVLDDGHSVDGLAEAVVELAQVIEIYFGVVGVELREVESRKRPDAAWCQLFGEVLELLLAADPAEDERKVVIGEGSAVQGGAEHVQQMQDVALRLGDEFLRAGVLEAEDHGCQTRQLPVQYLGGEVLRAGHIHCCAEAVLKQFLVGILVELLGFHDEPEVRVVPVMSHCQRMEPLGDTMASG